MSFPRVILEVFLASLALSFAWRLYTTIQFVPFLEIVLYAVTAFHAIRYMPFRIGRATGNAPTGGGDQRTAALRFLVLGNVCLFVIAVIAAIHLGYLKANILRDDYLRIAVLHFLMLGLNLFFAIQLRRERKLIFVQGIFLMGLLTLSADFLKAWNPPSIDESVVLQPPLAEGFVTLNGGNNRLQNVHFGSSPSYYLGVFAAQREAFRREGLTDSEHLYRTFGLPVTAPAAGVVRNVVSDLPDMAAGEKDFANPLGNHVVIEMAENRFLHVTNLKCDTVTVTEGESVRAGHILGQVGLSGQSGQPAAFILVTDRPSLFDPSVKSIPFYFTGVARYGSEGDPGPFFPSRNDLFFPIDSARVDVDADQPSM